MGEVDNEHSIRAIITMRPRSVSPAASENEFDIANALFGGSDAESDNEKKDGRFKENKDRIVKRQTKEILGGFDSGDSDDDIFIAGQQQKANRKNENLKGRTVKKGGGFQAMGLHNTLLKAITRKGFTVPTPIQRKAVPLILDKQDVVGMARTGSGKTAAFVIPMIQLLKTHSAKVGARAAIMSPSRELALQTLKVVKELGKGTDLRTVLLVGGDSLEEQFKAMTSNPDIIIATPGRFMHLKVEMQLDLSSVQYVVFDEADRLFEMGFAPQLHEILHGLPTSRQTLLFSATLPKSLVEFARAGLQEPKLVRLDAEQKISPDLENAFFVVKSADKEGALFHIIQDVIGIPTGAPVQTVTEPETSNPKKRKRPAKVDANTEAPTAHSTIIFTATKHHVEYLSSLLRASGYAVSYAYGSLDQTARAMNVDDFRQGKTNILVVTDVAGRGIDLPILSNVINYDFPSQPKIFIHRVGRTARAGRKGWSYNICRDVDVPYMLDLQLFLSRRLILGRKEKDGVSFSEDFVVGTLPREKVERSIEWINKLLEEDADLAALQSVAGKGEKLYNRTRSSASSESAKRAKVVLATPGVTELSLLFGEEEDHTTYNAREDMLARIRGFRPPETIFEIGKRGTGNEQADLVRNLREKMEPRRVKAQDKVQEPTLPHRKQISEDDDESDADAPEGLDDADMDSASETELEITFSQPSEKGGKDDKSNSWEDSEHFISYTPRTSDFVQERGYGVHSGTNTNSGTKADFLVEARTATMDLANDESRGFAEPARAKGMRWDKKNKKYVARANDEDGSKGTKYVVGESGQKIHASFRSGRFDAWRKSNKIDRMPRVGETEAPGAKHAVSSGKSYRHKADRAPKEADRFRDDYHERKKRVNEAREKRVGKFKDGNGKSELRGVDDVRKERKLKERRKEKNARPSKKRK